MNINEFANVNAWFTNIDKEPFDIVWGGKVRVRLQPGETKLLPGYLAESGGKHLTNKLLLDTGNPKMESYTSPKKPRDFPEYWSRFCKIVRVEGTKEQAEKRDALDTEIELLNAVKPAPADVEEEVEDDFEDDGVKEESKEESKKQEEDKKEPTVTVINKKKK